MLPTESAANEPAIQKPESGSTAAAAKPPAQPATYFPQSDHPAVQRPALSDAGSAYGYQERDAEIIDYQIWKLWTPRTGFSLRGPRPAGLRAGEYCTALGAAGTFGRFVPRPYPLLLGEEMGLQTLNLGFSGVGPSFYNDPRNSDLIGLVNRSKFVTIAFFSGRSQSNSLFKTTSYSQEQYILKDGQVVPADYAYQQLLDKANPETVAKVIAETRERYVAEFLQLLKKITVPKVLLWFSKRSPAYRESSETLFKLLSNFPHLINQEMVDALRPHCDAYVEQIGSIGLPQPLVSRFTQQPTAITRPRDYDEDGKIQIKDSLLTHNHYYPSPEMHIAATQKLLPICRTFC